jgi:hypothetical protein
VKELPKFPNDKKTLETLKKKPLAEQLVHYLNWRIRYVSARPRTVTLESHVSSDPRWQSLSANIQFFLKKVETGNDLTPHLSVKQKTKGFTPNAEKPATTEDRWADKDLLLNVMGFHHFHLGMTLETDGHIVRTDEVLLAAVSRDTFNVIGIFDHKVFESDDPNAMPAERARLWSIFEDRQRRGALPGALFFGGLGGSGISLSGHPTVLVRAAQRYATRIQQIDPKLDDKPFLESTLYSSGTVPAKRKLRWAINHLDLGVLDEATGSFFIFEKGPY